jgi:hypothetical protein
LAWTEEQIDKLKLLLDGLSAIQREDAQVLLELAEGEPTTIRVADLLYVTTEKKGLRVVMADGREYQTRASDTLLSFMGRVAEHPNLVRTHNSWLVNLEQGIRVARAASDEHTIWFTNGKTAPVRMNQKAVLAYWGIESLDHVIPWNQRLAAIISENLRDFEKDIRFMSDEEIRAHFSTTTTTPPQLIIRQLMGNIVWQIYSWIQQKRMDPLDGNIRSFWYSHIKPVLARFIPLGEHLYSQLTDVLAEYVGIHHLFRYRDLGLVDDSGSNKVIGSKHPHILVAAEKLGHWKSLQEIGIAGGVTIIALGGQPSLMTTEGLVDELAKVTDLDRTFHLITDVDYDPSGNIIAESFRRQLRSMGLQEVTRLDIIQPEHFTEQELKAFRYPVANESPSDKAKTRDWMDKKKSPFGGGLPGDDGQPTPYGLESDAMLRPRRHDLAMAAIKVLTTSPPQEGWSAILRRIQRNRPPIQGVP